VQNDTNCFSGLIFFQKKRNLQSAKHGGKKKRKIQQDATTYQILLFHNYVKLNMFQATHHPSSGGTLSGTVCA
jgi:hypothetical protein